MKNKKINTLLVLSTLFIVSCATTPDTYVPETYREDVAYFSPVNVDRAPANVFTNCFNNIRDFFSPPAIHPKVTTIAKPFETGITRYPKGFEGIKGTQIQYGFESEYLHEETEALLKNYMPTKFNDKDKWLSMTHEERLKYIDNNVKAIFPYREKGQLVKISTDPELMEVLPESFVYDAGHFEIVLDPMDTAEELIHKIKVINKNFGVGSMQMTISNPLNKKLLLEDVAYRQEMKAEILGYYNFMNDMDTLGKLDSGYERFLKDPNSQTVKSFNHPWLGPMTKVKHDKLEGLVNGILDQKPYTEEELKDISYKVVSHKFTGGLSFRPDVAYSKGRIASEVRDCHQNAKCIEDRIIRETYFLMKGKKAFASFKTFNSFDSIEAFNKSVSLQGQKLLKDIFPKYGNFTQVELELYRNFSYPFRDWSKHVEALNMPELKTQIENAQALYTDALNKIAVDYQKGAFTKDEARARVMGALGEFSKNSGLTSAMKSKYQQLLDPAELKKLENLKLTLFLQNLLPMNKIQMRVA